MEPDPHHFRNLDLDPDPHQGNKPDPDPYKPFRVKKLILCKIFTEKSIKLPLGSNPDPLKKA